MKFFHVYNESCIEGLEKNGLLNQDSGFKIQHAFSVPKHLLFNEFAAKGTKLHQRIKEDHIPFYVDRLAGGITYYPYPFDPDLIREYEELLGDWFLGFQLHESASNRRQDWDAILAKTDSKGPFDLAAFREKMRSDFAVTPDGTRLWSLSQDPPEVYAQQRLAADPYEFAQEVRDMYLRRLKETHGHILPCDSLFLCTKMQNELGMKTFMPEVGCQISYMRIELALARGIAGYSGKTWGAYYECWRPGKNPQGQDYCTMPVFNDDPSNEWYLTPEIHPDDFTSFGPNGGSSRLLQNRIYYYALMSGAHYFSEEWGLNCSYSDMHDFTLSEYGKVKKDFIRDALNYQKMRPRIPFAVVLPKEYPFVQLTASKFRPREDYLYLPIRQEVKDLTHHVEGLLKHIFGRIEQDSVGNEGHVITNSPFGDLFDLIYADADDAVFRKYDCLIDASLDGAFAQEKSKKGFHVLKSDDFDLLTAELYDLIPQVMPVTVSELCWLVSTDSAGRRFLSIYNNEGNERSIEKGDTIHPEADKRVTITFRDAVTPRIIKVARGEMTLEKADDHSYRATVPAAGFCIIEF